MNIAIAQTKILWKDKAANLLKAKEYAIEAGKNAADILVFPEMSFTGFCMDTADIGEYDLQSVNAVSKIAKEHSVAIGFGWVENTDGLSKNHYTIIDKSGMSILDYVKIHPFSFVNEDKYYQPGEDIAFCNISGVRMSVFICYDLRFAEPLSIAADRSELILIPANWPRTRREHFKLLLRARAIENVCYIVGVNCVGQQLDLAYAGDSCVISPQGKTLFQQYMKEGLFLYNIEGVSENVLDSREKFPVLQDRKNGIYDKLRDVYL